MEGRVNLLKFALIREGIAIYATILVLACAADVVLVRLLG